MIGTEPGHGGVLAIALANFVFWVSEFLHLYLIIQGTMTMTY